MDTKITLKNIVTANPSSYKVLENYGLDYCCGGNKTLKDACEEKSLDLNQIVSQIEATQYLESDIDIDKLSLTNLIDHIESTHHVFMKEEIPQILEILKKVMNRHNTQDLVNLQKIFQTLVDDITQHLEKEETILFPAVKELEATGEIKNFACVDKTNNPLATIGNPINQMEMEHEAVGKLLKEITSIIDKDDFIQCTSLEILHNKLKNLETDLHRHIHKENYVLFPKALKKENCC